MIAEIDPEPDQRPCVIYVGQDNAGHWLVQENHGHIEGRFISFETAFQYARSEARGIVGARVARAERPLVPTMSFDPVRPDERALARAA